MHVRGRTSGGPAVSQGSGLGGGRPVKTPAVNRIVIAALSLVLFGPLVGCGKKIGDDCQTQFDCNDEDDTRTCDISQPGGYCTIDGCDERSCPDDSACLRFFPRYELLSKDCDYQMSQSGPSACSSHELCLAANKCAPRGTELRRCMRTCDDGGDCRDGYECRAVGGERDTTMALSGGGGVKFCAPRAP